MEQHSSHQEIVHKLKGTYLAPYRVLYWADACFFILIALILLCLNSHITCRFVCACVHVHVYICVLVYMFMCTYVCLCTCSCVHMCACVHVHVYICVLVYMFMCTCVCLCVLHASVMCLYVVMSVFILYTPELLDRERSTTCELFGLGED